MRAFLAIEIPAEICKKIRDLIEVLQRTTPNVRWARAEGLHLTLKFIGQVPLEKIEEIQAQLASLRLPAPLPLRVQGFGYFPNERSPRVIWLGVEAGPQLAELAGRIEEGLYRLGIPKEDRPFSSHLTLGRLRAPDKLLALRELLRQREPLEMGSFTAEEFYLYESQLSPGGSLYRKIARFPLLAGVS